MEKLFKNLEVKPKICFGVIIFSFLAFILICSILYPLGSDEVRFYALTHENFLQTIKRTFLMEAPRLLNLFGIIGIYFGAKFKILFCVLNPIIQFGIVYGIFYFVKGRKLNLHKRADIFPFLFICLTYLFMTPTPSSTMFWMGGALNYSWAFLFSLLILCLFRYTYSGKLLKNTWYINAIWLFIGLAAGMSNENTGPMMFGISFCFIALCKYKHIKLPKYIYFIFFGIILGIALMFGLGGSYRRLHDNYIYSFFVNSDMKSRLFFSLYHFNVFLKALYFIPIITFLTLILIACDKKMLVIKQEKFILSVFFLLCGFVLAFVLFAAPLVAERAYFSAGIFCIISLMLLLDVFQDTYKIYLLKYLTLCFGIYCLIITPLVVLPYFDLYNKYNERDAQIMRDKEKGKDKSYTDIIYIIPGPTKNLTITYLDFVKHYNQKRHRESLKRWYGIEVIIPEGTFHFLNTNPLIKKDKIIVPKNFN